MKRIINFVIRWGLPLVWLALGLGLGWATWNLTEAIIAAIKTSNMPNDLPGALAITFIAGIMLTGSIAGFVMFPATLFGGSLAKWNQWFWLQGMPNDFGTLHEANKFRWHTTKHKLWVLWYFLKFTGKMFWRMIVHDLSKYRGVEARRYGKVLPRLKGSTYDSPGYKQLLAELQTALDHHYANNSHHPEHYSHHLQSHKIEMLPMVAFMDLYDFVEMWLDWRAAVKNHKDGDIIQSVKKNKDRFNMDDTAYILMNTAKGLAGHVSTTEK